MNNDNLLIQQLRNTLCKMELALGVIDVCIVWADLSGNILWTNKPFNTLVNKTIAEILGSKFTDLISLKLNGEILDWEKLAAIAIKDQNKIFEFQHENKKTLLEIQSNKLKVGKNDFLLILTLRDITQYKFYERQFVQAQKMEGIGYLAGGIAHDFNNNLMVIQGNLELLKMNLDHSDNENIKQIDDALTITKKSAQLIKSLMAFSRRQILEPQLLDLAEEIRNTIKLLKPILGESIDIQFNCDQNLWPIRLDAAQFASVLMNLSINSRDAMKGTGKLTIMATNTVLTNTAAFEKFATVPGNYLKISIMDTGSGIPAEILDQIFDPFFTTKPMGKGTGLGLSMVYGFIKQSQGYITVDTKIDKGTTFHLYLPSSAEVLDIKTIKKVASSTNKDILGHETILLVEDEVTLRKLIERYLIGLGYKVLTAENATAALKLLNNEKNIHLLLTDIVMPGELNGYELAAKAKEIIPNLKIIVTSGYPKNILDENDLTKQEYVMLPKPYTRIELANTLKKVLNGVGE